MAKKTRETAEQTRVQLLEAARALFLEHGVAKTTLEQIAKRAGYTRGAIHWHFKNKVEIFQAMTALVSDPLIVRLDEIMLEHPELNQIDAIAASFKALIYELETNHAIRETFIVTHRRCEFTDEFKDLKEIILKPSDDCFLKLVKAFTKAKSEDLIRQNIDVVTAAEITQSFMFGMISRWVDNEGESAFKVKPEVVIDNFFNTLKRNDAYN
ncbi:TetR family transcriptional regulator [Pseudomonas luteola]